jgi:glutathione S-transferase
MRRHERVFSMKLYYSPGACSLAAHIVAEEESLPLGLEKVDLKAHKTETGADYWQINPKGYVPALILDDGALLTENIAILQFLADRKPEAHLAPPPASMERIRLQEWLAYIATEIHKAFGPIFGKKPNMEDAKAEVAKRLAYVEAQLGTRPYLLGSDFTVADAYLFVMLLWCGKMKIDLAPFPGLLAYRGRIAARPHVQSAMKAEGLAV